MSEQRECRLLSITRFTSGNTDTTTSLQLPVAWIMHLSALVHPKCPSVFQRTYARRTFDRALRALPPSLHGRIWGLYLRWAEQVGGVVGDRVWRRLLKVGAPQAQAGQTAD